MPVQGPIHVDRPLTNISIAYKSAEGLVADQLFPVVPSKAEYDLYYIQDKAASFRVPDTLRANGAEANEDSIALSTASFRIEFHALKDIVTDRSKKNADPGLDLEISATEDLTGKILMQREIDAAAIFSDGAWANETSVAATAAWSLQTTVSDPILVAASAASVIAQNAGVKPNTCLLDFRAWQAVKNHLQVVDRVKYTSAESVGEASVARLFGVEKLLVASGTNNPAAEGLAAAMGFIFTDLAWFGYVNYSPGLRRPSALYCMKQGGGAGVEVRRWRDEERKGDWIEVEHSYDHITPSTDCGHLVVNPVQ